MTGLALAWAISDVAATGDFHIAHFGFKPTVTTDADAAGELERLRAAGVEITLPLMTEPWGERLFQVRDPDVVTVQLVEWVTA